MNAQPLILVVDDDREIRTLLSEYLAGNGFRTVEAADGTAMWKALDAARIDLIVLDLMMPGEDGLQLCRTLRARSNVPVIMLTARGQPIDRIVGLEMGADDYLAKPRSEEHTSELQSPCNLVCRLLLEKKKKKIHIRITI